MKLPLALETALGWCCWACKAQLVFTVFLRRAMLTTSGGHVIPHDDLDAWVAFFRDRAEEKAARLSAAGAATEGEKAKF